MGKKILLLVLHLHISHSAPYLPPTRPRQKKKSITFVFHFSWVLQPSQEKLKTMLMQNFEGANKVHYGRCASGLCIRKIFIVTWPYVRLFVRTTGIPMQNNSINRYGKLKATRGFFGGKSKGHPDFYREKITTKSSFFDVIFDVFAHIDNRERARASE